MSILAGTASIRKKQKSRCAENKFESLIHLKNISNCYFFLDLRSFLTKKEKQHKKHDLPLQYVLIYGQNILIYGEKIG